MRARALLAVGVAALASGSTAAAQTPDQVYDHDSPAGAEYQVPLQRIRAEAAGAGSVAHRESGGASGQHRSEPPLFGAGITPLGPGGDAAGGSARRGAGKRHGKARGSSARPAIPPAATVPSEGLALGLVAGSVLAVLLAGAAIGFALRRSRRPGLRD